MGSLGEDEDCKEVKLNTSKRANEESEGSDSKSKRIRISEPDSGVSEVIGSQKKEKIENGVMGSSEEIDLNVNSASCNGGLNSSDGKTVELDLNTIENVASRNGGLNCSGGKKIELDLNLEIQCMENVASCNSRLNSFGGEKFEFDLNLEIPGMENVASCNGGLNSFGGKKLEFDLNLEIPGMEKYEFAPVVSERRVEIIDIESDDDDDDEIKIVYAKDVNVRIDPFDKMNEDEEVHFLSNVLVKQLAKSGVGISSRGEKGKGKVPDDSSSDDSSSDDSSSEGEQTVNYMGNNLPPAREFRDWRELERREIAIRFARSNNYIEEPKSENRTSLEDDDELLRNSFGPFSTALKMIRERIKRSSVWDGQLIKWEPKPSRKDHNVPRNLVPSLLDLSLKTVSKNAESIVSLELVPDILRQRLTDMLCDLRKMNVDILELLLRGSPTEIRLKDCTWLTEGEFSMVFGNFNTKELMVFQLDLCGQLDIDYLMRKTFAQFSNSLPKLGIISLKGACRISDYGIKTLLRSTPRLQSINLSHCSLLTDASIDHLATSLGSILKELYIDECLNIDAMCALPALKKFVHLEVLSVAGIQTVSDVFVGELMSTCGQRMKELDFANCRGLTNYALKVIGDSSTNLRSLNLSNLEKLTDLGLMFLADGCRCIETLRLSCSDFSDGAIAAFLEASGESLKDLSLNNVKLVGSCTALSLAKCSRKLMSLDLSWCRKITNEALGLIVDSCSSLEQVKLFGCTQITNVFLKGHSNPEVKVIGMKLTPLLENASIHEPRSILLRYSPLG